MDKNKQKEQEKKLEEVKKKPISDEVRKSIEQKKSGLSKPFCK